MNAKARNPETDSGLSVAKVNMEPRTRLQNFDAAMVDRSYQWM